MIERAAGLVIAQKKHGACPGSALHQRIDEGRYLLLPRQNRLAGAGMLVAVPVRRLNKCITRQRIVCDVAQILRKRRNVVGIDAECIAGIAHGLLRTDGRRGASCLRAGSAYRYCSE